MKANFKWMQLGLFVMGSLCIGILMGRNLKTSDNERAAEKKYNAKWLVAHTPENQRLVEHARKFSEAVSRKTDGRVNFEIVFPPAKLRDGNNFDLAAYQLANNEVQVSQIGTRSLATYSKSFSLFDLPFLFSSHEHAAKVLDGKLGEQISARFLADSGKIRPLAYTYSGGFRVFVSNKKIASFNDLSGLSMVMNRSRMGPVPFGEVGVQHLAQLNPTTMMMFGVKPIWSQKTDREATSELDIFAGGEGELSEDHYSHYTRIFDKFGMYPLDLRHILESHHTLFLTSIAVNEEFFSELSENDQMAIREEAQSLALLEREDSIQIDQRAKGWLGRSGFIITVPSVDERLAWRSKSEEIYSKFADQVGGAELIKEILKLDNGTQKLAAYCSSGDCK